MYFQGSKIFHGSSYPKSVSTEIKDWNEYNYEKMKKLYDDSKVKEELKRSIIAVGGFQQRQKFQEKGKKYYVAQKRNRIRVVKENKNKK